MKWQDRYLAHYYDRSRGWVDGTTEFWLLCRDHIAEGARILEVGAGPTNRTSDFLAGLGPLDGADVDPAVEGNTALRQFGLISDGKLPFPNASYDACVSNYVLEHVEDPAAHLREVHRVLRPGGCYVFRTPNRFHYVALVASLTPHAVHTLMANRLRALPAEAHAPYKTAYRLNSRRAVRRHADLAGFDLVVLRTIEKEPSYGMLARPLFLAFMAFERLVNSTERAADLRSNILAVLSKRSA